MSATVLDLVALVRAVYEDMHGWAKGRGGSVVLAQNPQRLVDLLSAPAAGWRVIMHWAGAEQAGTNPPARGFAETHEFVFILDGQLAMSAEPGASLVRQEGTRLAPFLATLQEVNRRVLAYRFPWLGPRNDKFMFRDIRDNIPLSNGAFLAAYALRYSLFTPPAVAADNGETILLQVNT
jgi:hypothetical protein